MLRSVKRTGNLRHNQSLNISDFIELHIASATPQNPKPSTIADDLRPWFAFQEEKDGKSPSAASRQRRACEVQQEEWLRMQEQRRRRPVVSEQQETIQGFGILALLRREDEGSRRHDVLVGGNLRDQNVEKPPRTLRGRGVVLALRDMRRREAAGGGGDVAQRPVPAPLLRRLHQGIRDRKSERRRTQNRMPRNVLR